MAKWLDAWAFPGLAYATAPTGLTANGKELKICKETR